MKVLFIHPENNQKNLINDYQSDLLLHGLREIYGNDVIDYPGCWYLYRDEVKKKKFDTSNLWGKGFNIKNILDGYEDIDRDDIYSKIKKKFFDLVIFSSCRRSNTFLDEVIKYNNKFIFVDGEDDQLIDKKFSSKSIYFKRELIIKKKNIIPINFAIPESKIVKKINLKAKNILAPLIPGKKRTYIYDNEEKYNRMYQDSHFAITYKKAGWDCYRHYEILMNGCIPLFLNLENCPKNTMSNFPKKNLIEVNKRYSNILSRFNPFNIYKKKFLNFEIFKSYLSNIFKKKLDIEKFDKNIDILELKEKFIFLCRTDLTTNVLAKKLISNIRKFE